MQIEDVNRLIGERVADLRKGRFSQSELAQLLSEKLGKAIDPTTVTRLEGGKRPVAATELVALAEIFGVSPAALLPDWAPDDSDPRYQLARQRTRALVELARIRDVTYGYLRERAALQQIVDRLIAKGLIPSGASSSAVENQLALAIETLNTKPESQIDDALFLWNANERNET
ncbi:helix-turn-helix domain-containing protein [Nocardia sp. alder85J]|uniref:helix-turn-helix domain-containing protein n=1 Tax=Nocardia sp. alder85J TaxID=2862949 RepID=UPI001CD4F163|nr:helix-turn-helix transcriptional regulator [Nocardia sp. alder85J]MCX4095347.1 helix-turn-helix transcriptional regulator [Nocardia sp. alder85J]